ncbi:MAG TPA: hypothetical protein PLY70_13035 [Saprospiraceae bacterium]|nr:hypothetical protein [Saprospiraceae bacterium]
MPIDHCLLPIVILPIAILPIAHCQIAPHRNCAAYNSWDGKGCRHCLLPNCPIAHCQIAMLPIAKLPFAILLLKGIEG